MKPSKAAVELAQEVYEVDTGHASDELSRIAQAIQDAVGELVKEAKAMDKCALTFLQQGKEHSRHCPCVWNFRAALMPWTGGEDGK